MAEVIGSMELNWSEPQNLNLRKWDITAKGVYIIFGHYNHDYNNKAVYIGTNLNGTLGNRLESHKYNEEVQREGGNILQATYIIVERSKGTRFGIESYLHDKLKPIIKTEIVSYHVEVNLPPHF